MLSCVDVCWTHDWAYAERMTERMLNVWCVTAVFTRVSSSSQWILSAASNLSRHPDHFTMDLNITQLSLPGSICSKCILWRERERESICILWSGRKREREVYARTRSIYSSTPQRPLSCTCWESQRKPHLDNYCWAFLVLERILCWRMLTYADACWRMLGVPGWAEEVAAYRLVMRVVCDLMHISSDYRLHTL